MPGRLELEFAESVLSQAPVGHLAGEALDLIRAEVHQLSTAKSFGWLGTSHWEAAQAIDGFEIHEPASDRTTRSQKLRRYIVERVKKVGIDVDLLPLAQPQAQEPYLVTVGQKITQLNLPGSFPHETLLCAQAESARRALAALRRTLAPKYPEEPILAERLELGSDETRRFLLSKPELKPVLDAYDLTEHHCDAYVRAAGPMQMKMSELVQPALNRFTAMSELPDVKLIFDVTMDYSGKLIAGYTPSSNTITLGLKSLFLNAGKTAIFDIYHELGHEEQFVKRIWAKADDIGLRRVPQPSEIDNLAYKYGFYSSPCANKSFLQDVARIRNGRYLSTAQSARADALGVANVNYDKDEQDSSRYITNLLEREVIVNTHLLALKWRESPHLLDGQ